MHRAYPTRRALVTSSASMQKVQEATDDLSSYESPIVGALIYELGFHGGEQDRRVRLELLAHSPADALFGGTWSQRRRYSSSSNSRARRGNCCCARQNTSCAVPFAPQARTCSASHVGARALCGLPCCHGRVWRRSHAAPFQRCRRSPIQLANGIISDIVAATPHSLGLTTRGFAC